MIEVGPDLEERVQLTRMTEPFEGGLKAHYQKRKAVMLKPTKK